MAKMTPLGEKFGLTTDDLVDWEMPDTQGVKDRFVTGFLAYVAEKKRQAVETVMAEDFPHLAKNETFIENVLHTLGNNLEDERRFVFLVVNPKYRREI